MCHIFGFVFLLNSSQNMVLSTWQKGSEHLVMTEKMKLRERRHRTQIQTEEGESEKVSSGASHSLCFLSEICHVSAPHGLWVGNLGEDE